MQNLNQKTLISEIAEWASALKFEQIPDRVKDKAKLQILSVLAAIHSSAHTRAGKILLDTAKHFYGAGKSLLVPTGEKASLPGSVFAAAGLSVAQDYDDYLAFGHTGHSAVSVPLLLGAALEADPREILTAQIIANEIEGRIGGSVILGPHNGQTWSFIHLIGAAAAASRMLGLSPEKTAQALAISFYQPPYVLPPGFMGPDSKLLTGALPTVTGLQAAYLAEKGFTGALDILENHQGFLNHFSYYPLPMMISGLGKAWVTDTLAYKIYPGCAYIDTTVDAVLDLMAGYKADTGKDLDPEDVTEITVRATALTVEMDNLSKVGISFDPLNPVSINFSIPGNVAIALLKKKLTGEELREENLNPDAEQIKLIAGRVKLVHDLELTVEMIRKMNPSLKITELFRSLSLLKLARARNRIAKQYGRRMGLELESVLDYLRGKGAQALLTVGRDLRVRVGRWIASEPDTFKTWSLADADLENFTMPFSAKVSVKLRDGKILERRQDIPKGGPGGPLEERKKLVVKKFVTEAGPGLGEKAAREIAAKILELEKISSVKQLVEDLCVQK